MNMPLEIALVGSICAEDGYLQAVQQVSGFCETHFFTKLQKLYPIKQLEELFVWRTEPTWTAPKAL